MQRFLILLLLGGFFLASFASKAAAIVAFKKEFVNLYITDDTDEEFSKLVKSNKTGCLACHQGKKRKNRNAYGEHLSKLLDMFGRCGQAFRRFWRIR